MKKSIFFILILILLTACAPKPKTSLIDMPFAGEWSGTARNGDLIMDVIVSINPDCMMGEWCGFFEIPAIPCRGFYKIKAIEGDVYSFEIVEKSPACGTGADSMRLMPDGSLLWVSRGDYGESRGFLQLDPGALQQFGETGSTQPAIALEPDRAPLPVIYSDDGSPDGTVALFYLLSDPYASIQAVTISHGEARPQVYIQLMGSVLEGFGFSGIPLGAGADTAIIPGEGFPAWVVESSGDFWGHPPDSDKVFPVENASDLMIRLLNQSSQPLAVFISGPCTDLALALRQDPGIAEKISGVYIMGGAVYVPGNLYELVQNHPNTAAEWNIYVDPLAAKEVFASGIPIYLVPLDATSQVLVKMTDTKEWRDGGDVADLAAEFYDYLLNYSSNNEMFIWDVMTAAVMLHPELCAFTPLALDVVTQPGKTFGQTVVVEGGTPNVNVCLQPDAVAIRQMLAYHFATTE